jgi:hypothetical protein
MCRLAEIRREKRLTTEDTEDAEEEDSHREADRHFFVFFSYLRVL